jgi:hypothetical protein
MNQTCPRRVPSAGASGIAISTFILPTIFACSGSPPTVGEGGATGIGGNSAAGGAGVVGGSTTTTGGALATGGSPATLTTGGAPATGGKAATGGALATGGKSSTGGAATGGTSSSTCGENSGVTATKIYYVSPTGSSSNTGASFGSPKDFNSALAAAVAGEMILLQPGTYAIAYTSGAKNTINLTKSGSSGKPINIVAANCGRAVIDFSFPDGTWVQDSYGFFVTGNYWYFKGIDITRAGYQGAYVTGQNNTFENCTFHHNRNTGLEINEGGAYTTVKNCDSYRNYDPKKNGSMADGFGPKQTQGPGNKFIGCRSWENSDDSYDAYDSPETVTFEGCWAFRSGNNYWNDSAFAGNGNGFKVGGNAKQANHKLTNCVSFSNVAKGFDQNNNAGGITFYNCTAYNNGTYNFALGGTLNSGQQHVLKNNISLGSSNSIANASQANNSWSSGFSVSSADFASLDLTLATAARNPDGSLPANALLRLVSTSKLINAGVDIGLPYVGSAPDLGAFEYSP